MPWLKSLRFPEASGIFEILILALFFYYMLSLFRGTRGAPILTGFAVAFIASMVLTHFLHLDALNWLFSRFSVYLAVAVLVIFQPEIRQALAGLGKQHLFGGLSRKDPVVDDLVEASTFLANRKIGALIAVEQAIGMRAFEPTGTKVDAIVSPELLCSIFFPYTPLHDGGVIIRGDRIAAAGCMFPMTEREDLAKSMGARHRAAAGLSEETDAVIVVVSEENGAVSVCHQSRLHTNLSADQLRRMLALLLQRGKKENGAGEGNRPRAAWFGNPEEKRNGNEGGHA